MCFNSAYAKYIFAYHQLHTVSAYVGFDLDNYHYALIHRRVL